MGTKNQFDRDVEECYLLDEVKEEKKKEMKECQKVCENIGWNEDVSEQKKEEVADEKDVQKIQQRSSKKEQGENYQEQEQDNMEHEFVSESMDPEERSILDEDKTSVDPLAEIKSVWTCRFCEVREGI